jgi:hypothetical protein
MKVYTLLLTAFLSTSLSAQLNETALQVKQIQPEVYNGIRVLSIILHEGENYEVSQEINKQCSAYMEIVNYVEDIEMDVLLSLMRRFCGDQEQFDILVNQNDFERCFNLPIDWWLVNETIFNY